MPGYLSVDLSQFMLSISLALDAVEHEVLGSAGSLKNHSKRVAFLSVRLGQTLGMSTHALADLAQYAALHDNGLTEYVVQQQMNGQQVPSPQVQENFSIHCTLGEQNLSVLPFYTQEKDVILYHHENVDGSGMFGKRGTEIPLMSRIIRIFDEIDSAFHLAKLTPDKLARVLRRVEERAGSLFDSDLTRPTLALLSEVAESCALTSEQIVGSLQSVLPPDPQELRYSELLRICGLMAHIIDFKSPFTLRHSAGIAEKAVRMAQHFELDEHTIAQLQIAALLHDVGKLAVPNSLLDKPAALTPAEFDIIKNHVWMTHEILQPIGGFATLEPWASGHHERLDGTGYYRGSTGKDQDFCMRLMSCVDVYQALVEDRPYRAGMAHDRALALLQKSGDAGKLDAQIISAIDLVYR